MRGFWIVSLLAMSACIPFPRDQQQSPAIRGTLVAKGVPAENVTVRMAVDWPNNVTGCPSGSKQTLTDRDGNFSFAKTTYFSAFIFMGDRYDAWRICFDKPDGQQAIWQSGGFWGGPPVQEIRCDLDLASDPKAQLCTVVHDGR